MDEKRCEICGRPVMNTGIHRGEECYRLGYSRSHSRVEVLEKALIGLTDRHDARAKACNFTRCGCEDCESVRAALRAEVAPTPCAPTGGEK